MTGAATSRINRDWQESYGGLRVECDAILEELSALGSPENVAGMARLGINTANAYGISMPRLRQMARRIGKNHDLAQQLWSSGIHGARILAGLIDVPKLVEETQMESWAGDFDSWDVCDQVCSGLFDRTGLARQKAIEWSGRDEEFVKRAGFVLMAVLAVHDKKAGDAVFVQFLDVVKREAGDNRQFVKKAVNWALRQIGKRNRALHAAALEAAEHIHRMDSRSARWIASDALRELKSEAIQRRLDERLKGARAR